MLASESKKNFGYYQNVPLTDEEYQNLCDYYGQKDVDRSIDRMSEYMETCGRNYKNIVVRLEKWISEDLQNFGSMYNELSELPSEEENRQMWCKVKAIIASWNENHQSAQNLET